MSDCIFEYGDFRDAGADDYGAHKFEGFLVVASSKGELRTLFAAYGAVKTVTIVTDRDTGEPRGFAFVEMTTAGQAQDAIRALNGSVQGGRTLMVNEALQQSRT